MAKLILVTGGARSGKSSHALDIAEKCGDNRLFIATCPSIDKEMSDRIKRHQKERQGRGWQTIECETQLNTVFPTRANGFDVVLIDCLTLWINNILYRQKERSEINIDDFLIGQLCEEWLNKTVQYSGTVVCVTNEVGLGIVPDNALARRYRDLVGTCNQIVGKRANEVIFVSCGIPLYLKK